MAITREELIAWAMRNGWKLDRWGHLKKEFDNGWHRLKLSRIAARHELATPFGYYAEFGIVALCRTPDYAGWISMTSAGGL